MKKLLLLSLLFIISISCKKDEPVEPEKEYYRTYIMEDEYIFTNLNNGYYIPSLKGTVDFKKDKLVLRITQNSDLIYTNTYNITQEYSKTFDANFLYEGSEIIGWFVEKGHSGSTKDEIRLTLKSFQTNLYYKGYLSAKFY